MLSMEKPTSTLSLRPSQCAGVDFIVTHDHAMLLWDMGSGKTATVLSALEHLKGTGEVSSKWGRRVLILAPRGVAAIQKVWQAENAKWGTGLKIVNLASAASPAKRGQLLAGEGEVFVLTYDQLPWLAGIGASAHMFKVLVCDEISFLKNWSSRRMKILRPMLKQFQRRIGLTGTPTGNHLMNLFSEVYALDHGERFTRSITKYRQRYFELVNAYQPYNWTIRPDGEARIIAALEGLAHRIEFTDLPELVVQRVDVPLDADQAQTYANMEKYFLAQLKAGEVVAQNAGVMANKLRQITSGFVYGPEREVMADYPERLTALTELLESLSGQPLLCFYEYEHTKNALVKLGGQVLTPKSVDAWNRGEVPLLIAHPRSGGHGLNLQEGGNHICWFTLPWSLELFQQATARVRRPGGSDRVFMHVLHSPNTIEDAVWASLGLLDGQQRRVLDAVKSWAKGR